MAEENKTTDQTQVPGPGLTVMNDSFLNEPENADLVKILATGNKEKLAELIASGELDKLKGKDGKGLDYELARCGNTEVLNMYKELGGNVSEESMALSQEQSAKNAKPEAAKSNEESGGIWSFIRNKTIFGPLLGIDDASIDAGRGLGGSVASIFGYSKNVEPGTTFLSRMLGGTLDAAIGAVTSPFKMIYSIFKDDDKPQVDNVVVESQSPELATKNHLASVYEDLKQSIDTKEFSASNSNTNSSVKTNKSQGSRPKTASKSATAQASSSTPAAPVTQQDKSSQQTQGGNLTPGNADDLVGIHVINGEAYDFGVLEANRILDKGNVLNGSSNVFGGSSRTAEEKSYYNFAPGASFRTAEERVTLPSDISQALNGTKLYQESSGPSLNSYEPTRPMTPALTQTLSQCSNNVQTDMIFDALVQGKGNGGNG